MSPQGKVDLGARAEAMLASWPAPSSDEAAWESRAAKIVAAATNAPRADDAVEAALFAKPALEPEPAESQSSNVSAVISARSASGEKAMSQDSNPGSPGKPTSPSAAPTTGAVSKRPSLKELAARANQQGAASIRPSAPTPPPPSTESVPQDKQARASTPSPSVPPPKASVPPPRPVEAGKDDSGRVDLNVINQSATPEQVAAAAAAKPAAHDLVDDAKAEDKPSADDKPTAAADGGAGAKVTNIAEARAKKAKKKGDVAKTNDAAKATDAPLAASAEPAKKAENDGGGGAKWAILAILGLAAGGFLFYKYRQQPPPTPVATVVQEKPDTTPMVADQQKIAEEPKPTSTGLSIDSLPSAEPSAKAATKVAAAPTTDDNAAPAPPPEPAAPTALPTATGGKKPGDLSSAMAEAVGGSTEKPVNADDATPAAGKAGSQTIPEQPPQGSVASAIRAVAPGAKACVAGADDVSHASVTFSSSGTVSSVSVSGWAAKNGKADCVKAALKGANVGPFSKPSYTVSVPVRP